MAKCRGNIGNTGFSLHHHAFSSIFQECNPNMWGPPFQGVRVVPRCMSGCFYRVYEGSASQNPGTGNAAKYHNEIGDTNLNCLQGVVTACCSVSTEGIGNTNSRQTGNGDKLNC